MACACKVNREISYLQKKYGVENPTSKKSHFKEMFSFGHLLMGLQKVLLGILVILAMPFIAIYRIFSNKKIISAEKLVYGRK